MSTLAPGIVLLCETKLSKATKGILNETFDNKQFSIIPRFTKAGKEGLVIAIKHNTFKSVLDVTTTQLNTIMTVRLSSGSSNIRLILGYAPQEGDDNDIREEFFQELELEIRCCLSNGDYPLLVGDFNAKVEPSMTCQQGEPVSENGKLLWDILKENDLSVLNFNKKCTGKATHVIRTTGASSVIDYVAVSNELLESIEDMNIDEDTLYCPFRVIKRKNGTTRKLSDHNAMIVNLVVPRVKASNRQEKTKWNLSAQNLLSFRSEIENQCNDVVVDNNPQDAYNKFESVTLKAMEKTMKAKPRKPSQSFVVHKKFSHIAKEISKLASRGKAQRKVARQYREKLLKLNTDAVSSKNAESLIQAVNNISENDRFSSQKFWKTKKMMQQAPRSVTSVYRQNGEEYFNDREIVDQYREEFEERLTSVEIPSYLHEYESLTDKLYHLIVDQSSSKIEEPDFTMEELEQVIKNIKNGASGPDTIPPKVFKEGGVNFKSFLLKIINRLKKEKMVPLQWEDTNVIPIYKGKGPRKCLVNQRGIFLTQIVSKIWEKLIKARCESVLAKINCLQAGGRKEKSSADEMFLLRASIDHAKYLNTPLYINFYDFRQCFDKLWFEDSIISLHKLGLNNELLSLINCTNKRASITVQTPLGPSATFSKENIAKQGTVIAPTLCSASVAELCDEEIDGGMAIGTAKIGPLAYVDDLTTINTNIKDAISSNVSVCFFSDRKKQPLNETKCYLLPINVKPHDVVPTQFVNGLQVVVKSLVQCLGDIFNSKGDYSDLIKDRYRKGTICMANAMALCSNQTMGKFAIISLLIIYKAVFLQIILFNSETWSFLADKNVEKLSTIQMKFLKRMLHCPRGTSNSFILLELGLLPIEEEISIRQLMFLHHIVNLPESDVVLKVFEQQACYPFEKNWRKHIVFLLEKYQLSADISWIASLSKTVWKSMVHKAVTKHALHRLNLQCFAQSKTAYLCPFKKLEENKYLKSLPPQRARTLFQLRCGIYDLKGNRPFQYGDLVCRGCNAGAEDFDHVVNHCPEVIRNNKLLHPDDKDTSSVNELLARIRFFEDLVKCNDSVG